MSISEMIMPVLIPSGLSKFKNAGILLLVLSKLKIKNIRVIIINLVFSNSHHNSFPLIYTFHWLIPTLIDFVFQIPFYHIERPL